MRHLWSSERLIPFPDHKPLQEARPGAKSAKNWAHHVDQERHMPTGPAAKVRGTAAQMETAVNGHV